jgi:hypothetical protein
LPLQSADLFPQSTMQLTTTLENSVIIFEKW